MVGGGSCPHRDQSFFYPCDLWLKPLQQDFEGLGGGGEGEGAGDVGGGAEAGAIARLRDQDPADIAAATTANAERLFNLP